MSVQIKYGGPAFPSHGSMGEVTHEGATLRDYFAAKAMQGLMTNATYGDTQYDAEASCAYRVADAMIKAREPNHGGQ